jgi:glycosyltransferase involved in cell wall biosynthesis
MNRERLVIFLPDLRGGGAERVSVNLANSFSNRGYQVEVVLLSAKGEFLAELEPDIRVIDLHAKRLRYALPALIRYLRKLRPAVVLANMWPLSIIAIWARIIACVPTRIVVVEHTSWSRDKITSSIWGRYLVSASMHYTLPNASGIVSVSQGAADDLASFANLARGVITVIYNPIVGGKTPLTCGPLAPEGWWTGPHHKLLAVGNLSPIKDYSTLLLAFSILRQQVDAHLIILGEGGCRLALEAQAIKLGIKDSLFMPGFVNNPHPYYQRADLHILSSAGEGFGNVIVEALAAGTPVVSTDCLSGPREILCNGKFGRLVPVGDAFAMATAMAESLADAHDHAALKTRAQDFSIEKAVDEYEDLLFPTHRRP